MFAVFQSSGARCGTCTPARAPTLYIHLSLSRDYFLPPFRLSSTPLTFFSAGTDSRVGALNIKRHRDIQPRSFEQLRTAWKPSTPKFEFFSRFSSLSFKNRWLVIYIYIYKRKEGKIRDFPQRPLSHPSSYLTIVGENGGSGRCTLPSRSYKEIVHAWMILRGERYGDG